MTKTKIRDNYYFRFTDDLWNDYPLVRQTCLMCGAQDEPIRMSEIEYVDADSLFIEHITNRHPRVKLIDSE